MPTLIYSSEIGGDESLAVYRWSDSARGWTNGYWFRLILIKTGDEVGSMRSKSIIDLVGERYASRVKGQRDYPYALQALQREAMLWLAKTRPQFTWAKRDALPEGLTLSDQHIAYGDYLGSDDPADIIMFRLAGICRGVAPVGA